MRIALTATPSQVLFAPIAVRGEVADAFALAAELGFDGVELHLRQPGDVDRAAVMKLAAEHGLAVPTLGTGMAASEDGLTFTDPSPDVRRQAVERAREHISLAADLGSAVTIGLLSGRLGNDSNQRDSRRAAALSCLKEVCLAAETAGVIILLEPLNRYECDYINTIQDGLGVLDEIGAPNLKLLADTFHMNIEEADIAASLRQAGSQLGHVHLVDSNRRAPGYGHLDIRGTLQELRRMNYQGYLSFEVLPLPSPRQAMEDGIRIVKSILAEL